MSGFAMMYLQDPSLLSFQTRLQTAFNLNNLKTMFHMDSIPKDTQLRDVLDQAPTDGLKAIFSDYLNQLQRSRHLDFSFSMAVIWFLWTVRNTFLQKISVVLVA